MKLVLIGAGQRGRIYADNAYNAGHEIVAVVDPHADRRQAAAQAYGIPQSAQMANDHALFARGKIADVLIIASMDRDHFEQTMQGLRLGYDILLEKPISPDPVECLKIEQLANQVKRKVIVCHVLRYTPFFSTIKSIIDSGELGRVVSIQHNENIGNFHMAHSFVRGNWRNAAMTSPLIMQKSCHDMDILAWLADSPAQQIASFGDLRYFHQGNAPQDSAERCCDCPAAARCRFEAKKCYLPVRGNWPATVVTADQTEQGLEKALQTSPYGRCVYRCDNDVCDNQVVLIRFLNGVTVSFNLSAFTNQICRTIKVMCEHGEIRGHDGQNRIEVIRFTSNQAQEVSHRVIYPKVVMGGHGGGDAGLMADFLKMLEGGGEDSRSSVERSVESHIMAYAAEKARLQGGVVQMDALRAQLLDDKA